MKLIIYILIAVTILNGCKSETKKDGPTDNLASGTITIATDATLEPLIKAEIAAFQSAFPEAHIKLEVYNEPQLFEKLLSDSVRLIIAARELTSEEKKVYEARQMEPKVLKLASDGVAFISNVAMPDSINYRDLVEILAGRMKTWKQLNSKLPDHVIQMVFDNPSSSTVHYISEYMKIVPSANITALNDNQQVIEYVKKNKYSLGIIGLNWISDGRDKTTGSFYQDIHVMGVNPPDTHPAHGAYYKPYQAWLGKKCYPFTRGVYAISNEARNGLGTGFMAYLKGDGQTIVQQGGLFPLGRRAWIREVEIQQELK
jgi:phosphate transport system substrate-binding protein